MDPPMDKPSSQPSIPRLSPGCPFLGLKEDAETHFSTPSLGNYCHKVDPSEPVNFDHQDRFCLSDDFVQCVVFSGDWQGMLPETIRGDGAPGLRSPELRKGVIVTQQLTDTDPDIEVEEAIAIDTPLPRLEKEEVNVRSRRPISDEQDSTDISDNLPWKRLHEEARSRYLETKPNRREKTIWAGLIVVASIVFLVSMWGLYNRFNELQTQTELSMLTARTLTAIVANEQQLLAEAATATQNAVLTSIKESTPTPTATQDEDSVLLAEALTATAQLAIMEEPTVDVCSELSGYPIEIVSGPHLTPRPGYIYQPGSPEPVIQASWVLKNPGTCSWEQVVLQDVTTGENTVPYISRDGEEIDLTNLEQAIDPEDEIEISIGFRLKDAETINREWLLLINGFNLFDQSHVVLKIDDWIIIQQATATPTKVAKPTSKPAKPTSTSGRVTEKPPTRAP